MPTDVGAPDSPGHPALTLKLDFSGNGICVECAFSDTLLLDRALRRDHQVTLAHIHRCPKGIALHWCLSHTQSPQAWSAAPTHPNLEADAVRECPVSGLKQILVAPTSIYICYCGYLHTDIHTCAVRSCLNKSQLPVRQPSLLPARLRACAWLSPV